MRAKDLMEKGLVTPDPKLPNFKELSKPSKYTKRKSMTDKKVKPMQEETFNDDDFIINSKSGYRIKKLI